MHGLAAAHPADRLLFMYRPHRFLRSLREKLPSNCGRRILLDARVPGAVLFHGLNQRLPRAKLPFCVTTFHDLFVLTGDYSAPDFRARFARQAREAANRSDMIIAVSAFTANQVRDLLAVPPARMRVIPHGCTLAARPAGAMEKEKLILHVGAIQRRKNIARLVEAFEQVEQGWRLVLAGSMGFGAEEILSRIERSPRRTDIQVLGYTPQAELDRLYSRASVFAFPSLDEGFGMPVLEAMAAGVPVLTAKRSATEEVAGEAALLVDPEDTGSIAASLLRLTSEEELRRDLAVRGRARAAMFTWERAVDQTWKVYAELLG
jgi:glycosyltransferase involved in cell wall biosynthesis